MARLIRDEHLQLIDAIMQGRLTHFGAAVAAGYSKRRRRGVVAEPEPRRPAGLDPRALIG
jgi:hypothetical protein